MPKVFVKQPTALKRSVKQSSDLCSADKLTLQTGRVFYVTESAPARDQHVQMKLASPMLADDGETLLTVAYGYQPHYSIEGQLIKLPVRYSSQLNNDTQYFGPGWRQCNTTSNSMMADFVLGGALSEMAKQEGKSEPESVYMRYVAKYGDTVDHDAHTKALRELGIESYFSHTLSGADLLQSLNAKIPVVVGFAYKGSGHICLIVGHDPNSRQWLVHDPYGTRHGATDSYDIGIGGAFDSYSYEVMQQIFFDQGAEAGWGRIVTKIKGNPTGLSDSL